MPTKIRVLGLGHTAWATERRAAKLVFRREAVWAEQGHSIRMIPDSLQAQYIAESELTKLESMLGYDRRGMLTGREVKRIPVVVSEKLINCGTDQYSRTAIVGRVKLSKRTLVKDGVRIG